ncbi:RHS repeat-associated core domain-containing protein, partial [Lysobacter sp. Root690]|uniref:RHS repeat-associated core domain-containing protein n=1 Tax=Lysobacter sp. Root690 TaxID=1736588 RepID=UPI00138F02AB
ELDESGLYYYRARYYHPGMARFISEDPIGLAGGLNTYAYVEGDPIAFIDPLGLERFAGYCDALKYMGHFRSRDEALSALQDARRSLGNGDSNDWDARTPLGNRLRNAENYVASYVAVQDSSDKWHGQTGMYVSMFWAVPAYHGMNAVFKLNPHSPASSSAIYASWAGLADAWMGASQADPDCGCKRE